MRGGSGARRGGGSRGRSFFFAAERVGGSTLARASSGVFAGGAGGETMS